MGLEFVFGVGGFLDFLVEGYVDRVLFLLYFVGVWVEYVFDFVFYLFGGGFFVLGLLDVVVVEFGLVFWYGDVVWWNNKIKLLCIMVEINVVK